MERERQLRVNTLDPERNPLAKREDIKNMKAKFVNIWKGKKLTAIGCHERHNEPRFLAEIDEKENARLNGDYRKFGDYKETMVVNEILELRCDGVELTLDEMANMFNNEER